MSRLVITSLCAVLAFTAAGCGGKKAAPEKQVTSALNDFAASVKARKYQHICADVFAKQLLDQLQQVNLPCDEALRKGFASTKNPKITIKGVKVTGKDAATARILTSAEGQAPSEDVAQLALQSGRWRILSLGSGPSPTRGTD